MADFCKTCKHCDTGEYDEPCFSCRNTGGGIPTKWEAKVNCKPQTNADRIRAMSDDELAAFMFSMVDCVSCQNKLMNNGKLVFGADRKTCTDKDYYAMCDGDGRKCESVCLEWLKQPAETPTNADRCVCCGEIIPEGRQVCPNCLVTVKEGKDYGRENIE